MRSDDKRLRLRRYFFLQMASKYKWRFLKRLEHKVSVKIIFGNKSTVLFFQDFTWKITWICRVEAKTVPKPDGSEFLGPSIGSKMDCKQLILSVGQFHGNVNHIGDLWNCCNQNKILITSHDHI